MNNNSQKQLPTQVLAIIEVFGRENIEKITQIQSDEKPLSTTAELAAKEIEQLDLFMEVQNA